MKNLLCLFLTYFPGEEYKKENTRLLTGNKFPPQATSYKVSRGPVHKINNSFSPDQLLIKLKHHLSYNLSNFPKFSRISSLGKNTYKLKNTAIPLQDNLDDDGDSIYLQWYFLAPDNTMMPNHCKTQRWLKRKKKSTY